MTNTPLDQHILIVALDDYAKQAGKYTNESRNRAATLAEEIRDAGGLPPRVSAANHIHPDIRDFGTIEGVDGNNVTVAWDSGGSTSVPTTWLQNVN